MLLRGDGRVGLVLTTNGRARDRPPAGSTVLPSRLIDMRVAPPEQEGGDQPGGDREPERQQAVDEGGDERVAGGDAREREGAGEPRLHEAEAPRGERQQPEQCRGDEREEDQRRA